MSTQPFWRCADNTLSTNRFEITTITTGCYKVLEKLRWKFGIVTWIVNSTRAEITYRATLPPSHQPKYDYTTHFNFFFVAKKNHWSIFIFFRLHFIPRWGKNQFFEYFYSTNFLFLQNEVNLNMCVSSCSPVFQLYNRTQILYNLYLLKINI